MSEKRNYRTQQRSHSVFYPNQHNPNQNHHHYPVNLDAFTPQAPLSTSVQQHSADGDPKPTTNSNTNQTKNISPLAAATKQRRSASSTAEQLLAKFDQIASKFNQIPPKSLDAFNSPFNASAAVIIKDQPQSTHNNRYHNHTSSTHHQYHHQNSTSSSSSSPPSLPPPSTGKWKSEANRHLISLTYKHTLHLHVFCLYNVKLNNLCARFRSELFMGLARFHTQFEFWIDFCGDIDEPSFQLFTISSEIQIKKKNNTQYYNSLQLVIIEKSVYNFNRI